jgi:hypothetical protein
VDRYPNLAVKLPRVLPGWREPWPDQDLTQAQLAIALSSLCRGTAVALSCWKSLTNSKMLSPDRREPSAPLYELSPIQDGDK